MFKIFGGISLLIVLLSMPITATRAQNYPERIQPYINDYANLLSRDEFLKLALALMHTHHSLNIDITVLIILSQAEYDRSERDSEEFATSIFNAWGVGDPARQEGVLVVVSTRDRQIAITGGEGYGYNLKAPIFNAIDKMLFLFEQGEFGNGLYTGVFSLKNSIARIYRRP